MDVSMKDITEIIAVYCMGGNRLKTNLPKTLKRITEFYESKDFLSESEQY